MHGARKFVLYHWCQKIFKWAIIRENKVKSKGGGAVIRSNTVLYIETWVCTVTTCNTKLTNKTSWIGEAQLDNVVWHDCFVERTFWVEATFIHCYIAPFPWQQPITLLGQKKLIISFSGQFFQKLMRQGGFIFYCFRSEWRPNMIWADAFDWFIFQFPLIIS